MSFSQPNFPADKSGFRPADVRVLTSGGLSIQAHSSVLASGSSIWGEIIARLSKRRRSFEKIVPIHGVPCNAVAAFVRFFYTSRCEDEEMDKYGIHLLTLSHVFSVPKLKQRCARDIAERQLTIDNVVDLLQLSKLCDAPDLYIKCLSLVSNEFAAVRKTEGWKFVQDHDPYLELEILQFIDEAESRKKRWSKSREMQSLFLQLSEAMACLQHICTEGCTSVWPSDVAPKKDREPCEKFTTCRGLQVLIRHFATCKKRVNGECCRCKRMWQLLRLHSSICDPTHLCRVPLCRDFKLRMQLGRKGGDGKWKVLVRKVMSAKAMSSLSLPSKKREGEDRRDAIMDHTLMGNAICT